MDCSGRLLMLGLLLLHFQSYTSSAERSRRAWLLGNALLRQNPGDQCLDIGFGHFALVRRHRDGTPSARPTIRYLLFEHRRSICIALVLLSNFLVGRSDNRHIDRVAI